jgi:7,8-dihydroneopterin aldolase/epimerase/oxygenase
MAIISLEGMQFQGYHGVYPAERVLGSTFVVDVSIEFDLGKVKDDKLETAINYEAVHQIIDLLMTPPKPMSAVDLAKLSPSELAARKEREPKQLIETVAQLILFKLKNQFEQMHSARVRIRKLNPPLVGRVDASVIEVQETYLMECPRCKKQKFSCYKDANCWCMAINIHPATRESLKQQFGNKCLCPECLSFYSAS